MNVSYQSFRGDKRYQLPNIKLSKSESANCNNLGLTGRVTLNSLHPPLSKKILLLLRLLCSSRGSPSFGGNPLRHDPSPCNCNKSLLSSVDNEYFLPVSLWPCPYWHV